MLKNDLSGDIKTYLHYEHQQLVFCQCTLYILVVVVSVCIAVPSR